MPGAGAGGGGKGAPGHIVHPRAVQPGQRLARATAGTCVGIRGRAPAGDGPSHLGLPVTVGLTQMGTPSGQGLHSCCGSRFSGKETEAQRDHGLVLGWSQASSTQAQENRSLGAGSKWNTNDLALATPPPPPPQRTGQLCAPSIQTQHLQGEPEDKGPTHTVPPPPPRA